jgi:hypothetical protein
MNETIRFDFDTFSIEKSPNYDKISYYLHCIDMLLYVIHGGAFDLFLIHGGGMKYKTVYDWKIDII